MRKWVVYILKCRDDSYYTGITNDLDKRIINHNAGIGAKYTRGRGPFELIYTDPCEDRSAASKREFFIKKLTRRQKETLIQTRI